MAINPNTDFTTGAILTAAQQNRFPRGITGIRELRRRINAINGKNTTDQAGVAAVQAKIEEIIALKQEALEYLACCVARTTSGMVLMYWSKP